MSGRLRFCMSVLIAFALWALCACASAEVKLSAELEKNAFHGPDATSVRVLVSNGNPDPIGNLVLSVPGRKDVLLAETLDAGVSLEFESAVQVNSDALSLGFVSVTLRYDYQGVASLEQTLCNVRRLEDKVEARLVCALPDRALVPGETVTISYTLVNTGETDITGAVITCMPDGYVSESADIPAGERLCVERAVPYEVLALVSARADCKSAVSGAPYSFEAAAEDWTELIEDLRLTVIKDESVNAGEKAHLTLQIENLGSCSYTGINAEAEGAGRFRGLPGRIGPGDFVTASLVTDVLAADTVFAVTLTALREDGERVSFSVPEVTVKVSPPNGQAKLSIEARQSDSGIAVTVQNGGERLRDIHVGAVSLGDIRVLTVLEANGKASLLWEPEKAGEYILYARCEDLEALSAAIRTEGREAEEAEGTAESFLYGLIGIKRLPLMLFCAFSLAGALLLAALLRKGEKKAGRKSGHAKRGQKKKKA